MMTTLGRRRALALVLLSSAFLSACGLKPEVKDQLAQGGVPAAGSGAVAGTDGTVVDGAVPGVDGAAEVPDGSVPGADTAAGTDVSGGTTGGTTGGGTTGGTTGGGGGTTGGTTGGGGGGGGTTGGTSGGGGGGGTTGGGGGAAPAPAVDDSKGTTTGIDFDKKTIKIVLHGPLTGAGVPQESFRTGTPKYWKDKTLKNGFKVIAEAVDDKYNAPDALRACNRAAKEAFLIVGGAGTDQIQACAQSSVLRRGNVPYLSSGVTEAGLGKLPNYFATSLTYKQQGPLVVKMAADNGFLKGRKWAVVITEGPNFADARESIVGALNKAGVGFNAKSDVFLTDKAPRDCSTLSGQLRNKYTSIYFLGQPSFFIQCVTSIGYTPTYKPTYTGVGPSFGIHSVTGLACRGTANQYQGFFLNPAPGLDTAQARAGRTDFQDDIEYSIYGAMQGLESAFNQVQGKLTREKFIATLRQSQIPAGVLNPAVFKGQVFGGTAAFGLKGDCSNGRTKTLKTYAK